MPIEFYPNISKVKRNGAWQNLPGFVQPSADADIEAMLATAETTTTAQYPHKKGSFFILNNILYEADENISVNDTIAVGTNCHVSVLSDKVTYLADIIDKIGYIEERKIVDAYSDANSDNAYVTNSPFVLINDTYTLYKMFVCKIKLNAASAGVLTIGTIKKNYVQLSGAADRSKAVVKAQLTINTGVHEIDIPNPFYVNPDEYIFIGLPTDTCYFKYGDNGTDKTFAYDTGDTWQVSERSIGVDFYGTAFKYNSEIQNTIDDVKEIDNLLSTSTENAIYKSKADDAGSETNMGAAPFIITNLDYSDAPYTINAIRANFIRAGFLTVGRVAKVGITSGADIDMTKFTQKQTLEINNTGVQTISFEPIEITNDYYFFIGMNTDTVKFLYGGNWISGLTTGFLWCSTTYAVSSALLGVDLLYIKKELVNNVREAVNSTYKGKKLSILGDSISTFTGYIPEGNLTYYPSGTVQAVTDTWWKKLADALGMVIDVNNSWSGSRVTTTAGDTSAGCMSRCENLGTNPDVIIVWMGINDFNNEVALGTYDGKSAIPVTTTTFREAYGIMLNKILTKYKTSEVWICTLPQCERNGTEEFPEINENSVALADFNVAIRELADSFGVRVLEHNKCGLTYQNMSVYNPDELHPNKFGHSLIANNDIWQMDNAVPTRYALS